MTFIVGVVVVAVLGQLLLRIPLTLIRQHLADRRKRRLLIWAAIRERSRLDLRDYRTPPAPGVFWPPASTWRRAWAALTFKVRRLRRRRTIAVERDIETKRAARAAWLARALVPDVGELVTVRTAGFVGGPPRTDLDASKPPNFGRARPYPPTLPPTPPGRKNE